MADGRWSTGAAFGDYDGDGFVDLMVVNYVDFHLNDLPTIRQRIVLQVPRTGCAVRPARTEGGGDSLFHNNGDGTFTDVPKRQA